MKTETALSFGNRNIPVEQIHICVRCRSRDVFHFEGDVFCNPCGWNSIEARVESQLSDQTATYHADLRARASEISKPKRLRSNDSESAPALTASVA